MFLCFCGLQLLPTDKLVRALALAARDGGFVGRSRKMAGLDSEARLQIQKKKARMPGVAFGPEPWGLVG